MTPTLRDPADLVIHPALEVLPDWERSDGRMLALVEDIRERGLDQPLMVDSTFRIVDGRKRWRAARLLQLKAVPVVVRADGELAGIVLNSLLQRAHWTKSQLAYIVFPLVERAYQEAQQRHLERLKNWNKGKIVQPLDDLQFPSKTEDFAVKLGVSRALFLDAAKVHALFQKHKERHQFQVEGEEHLGPRTFREYFEPLILDQERPMGLGAVVAGIAGYLSTRQLPKREPEQLFLFKEVIHTLAKRFAYWPRLSLNQRYQAEEAIEAAVAVMPEDLREVWLKKLKAASARKEGGR
jgi:hypothetical protein